MKLYNSGLVVFTALFACSAGVRPTRAAGLTGRLAYVQGGMARVMTLPSGATQTVANSRGAVNAFIAPRGGTLLFFKATGNPDDYMARGWMSRPPYRTVRALPEPLNRFSLGKVSWSNDGSAVLFSSYDVVCLFRPATNTVRRLAGVDDAVLSADGQKIASTSDGEVKVLDLSTGDSRALFSWRQSEPMMMALRRAVNPRGVRDLLQEYDPQLASEARNWAMGGLAFSRDGKTLFWASNAGTSSGASGNTTFAMFASDLSTGRLSALSKLGTQFGRIPHISAVSPNGERLLIGSSAHSSAVDNPVSILDVYLPTQAARTVFDTPRGGPYDSNLENGTAWSPDSGAFAVSGYFYSLAALNRAMQAGDPIEDAPPQKFTLWLRDARTGRTLRTIRGAIEPSWGR